MILSDSILMIDAEAMVIDKPAGLPVDPPRAGGPSVTTVAEEFRLGFVRAPTPVHRLDRDTSGCLLLARNPKAHKRFAQAFADGLVTKTYLAVLEGIPDGESGTIDMPLVKVSTRENGWRMVPDPAGKPAVTDWELLATANGRALVRFAPHHGRTHQLRVHAASGLGVPIVGDPVYGRKDVRLMLLHAATLTVPRVGKPPIEAVAPFPARFATLGFDLTL